MRSEQAPPQEIKEQPAKNRFVDVKTLFDGMTREEEYSLRDAIYENYVKAMEMRGREPLEEESFDNHFFRGRNTEKSIAFGNGANGYLFGSEINDVFVPTHFAPAGLRQGYRLVKELLESEKPTALFITQDLVDTIQKMDGWKILPYKIQAHFRGVAAEKILVVSQWSALQKLASHTLSHMFKDRIQRLAWRLSRLGEKAKKLIGRNKANANDLDAEVEEFLENNGSEGSTLSYLNRFTKLKKSDARLSE